MKNKINKILLIISCVLIVSILFLAILGSIERIGYLSEFKLNKSLSKKNAYFYDFRIKYYSKIFRNSDIYKVNFEIPKTAYINRKLVQFKNALFDKKGESPFASFTSTQELKYDDKINGINYTLQLKLPFYIILIIGLLYILINYKLIFYVLKQNKNLVLKIYKVSSILILLIVVTLFILGKIEHKAALEDLELIAYTKTGYTYKARIANKGLFSENIIYKYSDKPMTLKNKPDYIKNYGYSLELNKPDWYDRKLSKIWNNTNGTFIISNNAPTYIVYRYDIELSMGEKYAVTLESRKLNTNISGSIKYHLNSGEQTEIPNTYKMTDNYEKYTSIMEVKKDITSEVPSIRFFLPQGVFDIKSIKVEQVSDSLYIKTDNTIIFTSNKKIENIQDIINIKYKLNLNSYLFILLIITASLIIIYINIKTIIKLLYIIYNKINNIVYDCNNFLEKYVNKTYQSNNIYIIAFIILFSLIFLFYESIYASMPYYYARDSSFLFSKDIFFAYNNIMPEHYLHPNMIPIVIYKYIIIPISLFFNIISNIDLNYLQKSSNPYLVFAEFTEYLLTVSKLLFYIFITIMYINIVKIIKINNFIKNNIFIFLMSSFIILFIAFNKYILNGGIYFGSVIRYETMGLLLASISLYFIILSSETNSVDSFKHKLYIIISGILIGGGILSKILVGAWLIPLLIIYLILNIDKYNSYNKNVKLKKIAIVLNIFTVILILFNIVLYYYFINDLIIVTSAWGLIPKDKIAYFQIILPLCFIIFSVLVDLVLFNIIKVNNNIKLLIYNTILFMIFCILPILFSVLLPYGLDTLFITYIYSYAGGSILALTNMKSHTSYAISGIKYLSFVFIFITLTAFLIISNIKIFINIIKNNLYCKIILSIILIITSFIFIKVLRSSIYDQIISYSILMISIFIFVYNLTEYKKYKYILIIFLFLSLGFISFNNIVYVYAKKYYQHPTNRIMSTSGNRYNYKAWKTTSKKFTDLLLKKYNSDEMWFYTLNWSKDTKKLNRLLKQINIKNNNLSDTIIAVEKSYISDNKYISSIDSILNGGLLIPLNEDSNTVYVREDYMFYFVSDIEYNKKDKRIKYTDYNIHINNKKYFVYQLNIERISNYKIRGAFNFIMNEDFNDGFILINDRFSKGL